MYGELASVQGIVDLSPEEALDRAEGFLASQGYTIEQRTYTTVLVQRQAEGGADEQGLLNLTVAVAPQPGGGVRLTIRGNDPVGVQERRVAWMEWSESLPKKPESQAVEVNPPLPPLQQAQRVDLPPPPQVPPTRTPVSPAAPPRRHSLGFWVVLGTGGCLLTMVRLNKEAVRAWKERVSDLERKQRERQKELERRQAANNESGHSS